MLCSFAFAACAVAQSSSPPSCAVPNALAGIVKAVAPDYPYSTWYLNLGPRTAIADVTIAPDGKLADATIDKSSGNAALDAATLVAAHQSTYSPKIENCNAVVGHYFFRAEFWPDDPLSFLRVPQFSAPAGWSLNREPDAPKNYRIFAEWARGKSVMGVMGAYTVAQPEKFIADRVQLLTASGVQSVSQRAVSLCNGAPASVLSYSEDGTTYVELFQFVEERVYEMYFYSPDPADETIMKTMQSLCAT